MYFRKKSVLIEAVQWFKIGDHLKVGAWSLYKSMEPNCKKCDSDLRNHGRIETLEGPYIVCPGDWIITGIKGEHYPCKPDIFEATYEPAE